jgi:predicted DNA-binding protein
MPHIQVHIDEELHKQLKHLSVSLGKSQGDLLKEAVAMLLSYYTTQGESPCQKKT